MFNSTVAHSELYETCMLECFCQSNEQWKEVIFFVKYIKIYLDSVFMWQLETQLFASSYIWHTFSSQVTAWWWRHWLKNRSINQNSRNRWCLIVSQVLTNQNARNRWWLIVRHTISKRMFIIFSCDHILMSSHV